MLQNCQAEFSDPFRCPSKEEYLRQLMALLPRGRAWQSHEDDIAGAFERWPDINSECGDAQCGDAQCGQQALRVERTVMAAYWAAFAEINEYFAQRACKLLDEFFCQTVDETRDWWGDDYGFPDPCDPWDELCEKVAAIGGANCAYIKWAAGTRGWLVDCRDCTAGKATAMAGCAMAGRAYSCGVCEPNALYITIDLENSPAYTVTRLAKLPYAGNWRAGSAILCQETNVKQMECLIERIKPAHVLAIYHWQDDGGLSTL